MEMPAWAPRLPSLVRGIARRPSIVVAGEACSCESCPGGGGSSEWEADHPTLCVAQFRWATSRNPVGCHSACGYLCASAPSRNRTFSIAGRRRQCAHLGHRGAHTNFSERDIASHGVVAEMAESGNPTRTSDMRQGRTHPRAEVSQKSNPTPRVARYNHARQNGLFASTSAWVHKMVVS